MLVVCRDNGPDAGTPFPPLQLVERPAERTLESGGKGDRQERRQMPRRARPSLGNGSGRCETVQKRYRSLYSSGLSIYRITRPHWPLPQWADSGPGLSGFPILPLRENPAHTKVKDGKSKSRRTKKERLSTNATDSASTWMLPKKKKTDSPGPVQ